MKDNKNTTKEKKTNKTKDPFYKKLIAVISWIAVLMLWGAAASVLVNPIHFRYLSVLGLAFPGLAAAVAGMFFICLLFARNKTWIPLLGLIGSSYSLYSYFPINLPSPAPKGCMKIITYNTMGFATYENPEETTAKREELLQYLDNFRPDIFCFQEGATVPDQFYTKDIVNRVHPYMPHHDRSAISGNILGCMSKYPILGKDTLYCGSSNGSIVFRLKIGPQDTLHVINCHLQSMGLSNKEREEYHDIVRNHNKNNVEDHSKLLISKISRASLQRSLQVDDIVRYIERHKGKNMIVCGDFNDTPISYAFHSIHSTGLTDVYSATACGLGRSFNRDAIIVRIDHMFCSQHWKPYGFKIDNTISASDHYPLVGYLKRVDKTNQ